MPFSNRLKILNLVPCTPIYFSTIALTLTLSYTAFNLKQEASDDRHFGRRVSAIRIRRGLRPFDSGKYENLLDLIGKKEIIN